MLTEKETMLRAKMYMLKLAAGINPIDDSDISNDSALQNERLKKCFTYVAEVLDNASGNKNNIKKGYKEPRAARQPFSITSDEIASIELIPHDCVISELTAVINEAAEKDGMKKLQAARINDWLVNQGYLQDNTNAQGKNTRELTPKSTLIGIKSKPGMGSFGAYTIITYSVDAQRFIVDNLQDIVEYANAQLSAK